MHVQDLVKHREELVEREDTVRGIRMSCQGGEAHHLNLNEHAGTSKCITITISVYVGTS